MSLCSCQWNLSRTICSPFGVTILKATDCFCDILSFSSLQPGTQMCQDLDFDKGRLIHKIEEYGSLKASIEMSSSVNCSLSHERWDSCYNSLVFFNPNSHRHGLKPQSNRIENPGTHSYLQKNFNTKKLTKGPHSTFLHMGTWHMLAMSPLVTKEKKYYLIIEL